MYWADVFWCLVMYSLTRPSPTASIASASGGYNHLVLGCRRGFVIIKQQENLLLNPPKVRQIWGVATHVSEPKRRTVFITALERVTDVLASSTSFPIIWGVQDYFLWTFLRLATTYDQSSSVAVRRQMKYLYKPVLDRGCINIPIMHWWGVHTLHLIQWYWWYMDICSVIKHMEIVIKSPQRVNCFNLCNRTIKHSKNILLWIIHNQLCDSMCQKCVSNVTLFNIISLLSKYITLYNKYHGT